MKKIIILLLTLLMSACSAVKPAETLSSMQTEPTAETTVTETAVPKETTEATPKETEKVIETPRAETTAPFATEQKLAPETTAGTMVEAPVEPIHTETTPEPPKTQETHAETVKEDKPTEIPETVETPSESVTEPPKAEFDVNYWISFAKSYALQIGLEIDPTAVDCWDNPTTANADCIYLERDLTHRLDRYNRDDDITAVNIWAESLGNGNYLIYIAYLTDEEAIITMVDSNLQREHILPSEKAFAYKMKLEAMKHQGKRTSDQVGQKFSVETIADNSPDSKSQVQRYIRLTNLIPDILKMVDEGRIALTPAVELSYLNNHEQEILNEIMSCDELTPSLSQAQRLRKLSEDYTLTDSGISQIMSEIKGNQKEYVRVPTDSIRKYFTRDTTVKQMEQTIVKAMEFYNKYLERQRNDRDAR